MSGLIREEIPEELYDFIKDWNKDGYITYESGDKVYLTASTNICNIEGIYKYFAMRVDYENLTPGEVLNTVLTELENLKRTLRRI
jgi:hypothetical protein